MGDSRKQDEGTQPQESVTAITKEDEPVYYSYSTAPMKNRTRPLFMSLILAFIVLSTLSGIAMMALGIWTLLHRNEYNILLDSSWFVIIVGLMIGIGGVVVLICTCGCYGAMKEHRYLLISFLIMLTLVFIVQLSVGILAFVHRTELTHDMQHATRKRMNDYGIKKDITEAIDRMQRDGCVDGLTVFFRKHLLVLGCLLVGIAALQLMGLTMTACLLRFVDDYY